MSKVKINITVDEDILKEAEELRKVYKRTRSGMINWLLAKALGRPGSEKG